MSDAELIRAAAKDGIEATGRIASESDIEYVATFLSVIDNRVLVTGGELRARGRFFVPEPNDGKPRFAYDMSGAGRPDVPFPISRLVSELFSAQTRRRPAA